MVFNHLNKQLVNLITFSEILLFNTVILSIIFILILLFEKITNERNHSVENMFVWSESRDYRYDERLWYHRGEHEHVTYRHMENWPCGVQISRETAERSIPMKATFGHQKNIDIRYSFEKKRVKVHL